MTYSSSLFGKLFSFTMIGQIGLVLSLTSFQENAQAQISISPQIVELNAKQGQSQGSVLLVNGSPSSLSTKSYIIPFTYDPEGGFKQLKDSPQDLTPYIQLYPASVTLKSTEQRRFRFIVRLAPNLPDGEYRAMIITSLGSSEPQKVQVGDGSSGSILTVNPQLGVAVYVRKGNVNPEISVSTVNWDANKSQLKILVKNSGKASSILRGEWTLKQDNKIMSGGEIKSTTVISESERSVNVSLVPRDTTTVQKLAPGRYQIEGNIFSRNQTIPYQVSFEVTASK